jgi:hypothetical protein
MTRRKIVVLGTVAGNPYAGMAWMTMQITAGLARLGHDVHYLETTSDWPYDPEQKVKLPSSDYAVRYLARVTSLFSLADRWAYRRSYADNVWLGPVAGVAEQLLSEADAVLNVAGATSLAEDGLAASNLVLFGTDPVVHELRYAEGIEAVVRLVDEHDACVTYGENIGTPASPVPPLPRLVARTRQPALLDLWNGPRPERDAFTTVSNWKQLGLDMTFQGETYRWSKHHELLRVLDLPRRVSTPLELAMNLEVRPVYDENGNESVPAFGLESDEHELLESHGWRLVPAQGFTMDPWPYRDYIRSSRGEFSVARDLNVRLSSGWFSERSACYLAAGRPVITQDTGFGTVLPTGEGLFAFREMDDILAAFDAVATDYERHSRAARAIAEEFFRAETVLGKLLDDLGI